MAATALAGSPPPRAATSSCVKGQGIGEIAGEDLLGGGLVGPLDLDLHVEASGAQDGRVDEVLAVGGPDHDDVAERLDAVDLGEQLGHDRRLHVGGDPAAPRAEKRVHLVEKDDHGDSFFRLLPGALEHEPDLALGLAHVLVQQLGSLDVEEVAADPGVAGALADFLRKRVGDGFGDEGLAAAGGAVEQDPFRCLQPVLGEQLPVQVGQLDGVGYLLDLAVEAADIGVGDVRHLLEHDLFQLGARQLLVEQHRARVHEQRVPGAKLHARQVVGDLRHLLLVGATDDESPPAVLEHLENRDDLAPELGVAHENDVQRLVEDDLLAFAEVVGVEPG